MTATTTSATRLAWFRDARFGMFIHFGLYAIPGRGEWAMVLDSIPATDYARLADHFQPQPGCAEQWADLAVAAGMRYAVLTTRHADGFCLFDSAHSVGHFTAPRTACGRDLVAEFVTACRSRGLRVGLYYHLGDWREPGYFFPDDAPDSLARMRDSAHAQVAELMTNYGPIDLLWYDGWYWNHRGPWAGLPPERAHTVWQAEQLNAMVRRHQPNIIINDRSGIPEDFTTPEQRVEAAAAGRAWEACMTISSSWGHLRHDAMRKTPGQLLRHLVEAASQGGNLLLNIGPAPDGSVIPAEREPLLAIGHWLRQHGPAIYGADLGPAEQWWYGNGRAAQRANTLYFYLYQWQGAEAVLPDLATPVRRAYVLATGQEAHVHVDGNRRTLISGLPETPPDPFLNILVLECDTPPRRIRDAQPCWWTAGQP